MIKIDSVLAQNLKDRFSCSIDKKRCAIISGHLNMQHANMPTGRARRSDATSSDKD